MTNVSVEFSHYQGDHAPGDRVELAAADAKRFIRAGVARLASEVDTDDGDGEGPSKAELLERARELDIKGRSGLNRDELLAAVEAAEAALVK